MNATTTGLGRGERTNERRGHPHHTPRRRALLVLEDARPGCIAMPSTRSGAFGESRARRSSRNLVRDARATSTARSSSRTPPRPAPPLPTRRATERTLDHPRARLSSPPRPAGAKTTRIQVRGVDRARASARYHPAIRGPDDATTNAPRDRFPPDASLTLAPPLLVRRRRRRRSGPRRWRSTRRPRR